MQLKRYECRSMLKAISQLDVYEEAIKDANGNVHIAKKPYLFADAKPRYAMAKTQQALKKAITEWEAEQRAILENPGDQTEKLLFEAASKEVEVDVHKMQIGGLRVHDNNIPATVLGDLLPMIEGEL